MPLHAKYTFTNLTHLYPRKLLEDGAHIKDFIRAGYDYGTDTFKDFCLENVAELFRNGTRLDDYSRFNLSEEQLEKIKKQYIIFMIVLQEATLEDLRAQGLEVTVDDITNSVCPEVDIKKIKKIMTRISIERKNSKNQHNRDVANALFDKLTSKIDKSHQDEINNFLTNLVKYLTLQTDKGFLKVLSEDAFDTNNLSVEEIEIIYREKDRTSHFSGEENAHFIAALSVRKYAQFLIDDEDKPDLNNLNKAYMAICDPGSDFYNKDMAKTIKSEPLIKSLSSDAANLKIIFDDAFAEADATRHDLLEQARAENNPLEEDRPPPRTNVKIKRQT